MLLCAASFSAGFVDAIVGGGGLIQVPTGLILMPNLPVATVIGTLKIPAFSGTFFAAKQYIKKVQIEWKTIALMCVVAFSFAFLGSELLSKMGNKHMKPILFCVLIIVAVYTYTKKSFGQTQSKDLSGKSLLLRGLLLSAMIGFYDGFIGPGTGSFLVLGFIALMGYDFYQPTLDLLYYFLSKEASYGALPFQWPFATQLGGYWAPNWLLLKGTNLSVYSFYSLFVLLF
jgi:uncharacterized membrane protein YfcA